MWSDLAVLGQWHVNTAEIMASARRFIGSILISCLAGKHFTRCESQAIYSVYCAVNRYRAVLCVFILVLE